MKQNFHILTLGCPKNEVDSEGIGSALLWKGLRPVDSPEDADVILINTCGFIEDAKKESIDEIFRIIGTRKETQKVIVFGCLTERYSDEIKKEIPEIDAVFGVDSLRDIEGYITGSSEACDKPFQAEGYRNNSSYGYLKIAEGCDRKCSFCTIPSIRGGFRSLNPDTVLRKAEGMIKGGVKEIILIAQDITSYGKDLGGYGLPDLIGEIASIPGDFWMRLLYLYPVSIDERLLRAISENTKVCRYLDIPFQHSDQRILGLMNRPGAGQTYRRLINEIRAAIPDITLRSSFIVGFPAESDEEFHNLLDFVRESGFDRLGAFIYSNEEGTGAYKLRGQVPPDIRQQRYHELMTLQSGISLGKNESMIGRTLKVVVDETGDSTAVCRYEGQAPEIDGVVLVDIGDRAPSVNEFVRVRIRGAYDYDLRGELI